jgi:hypothetical protein
MKDERIVGFIAMALICGAQTSASPCPLGIAPKSPYAMNVAPLQPAVGGKIDVTIEPKIPDDFVVCLDAEVVDRPTVTTIAADKTTQFEFIVPGDRSKGQLTGIHAVSVVAGNLVYMTELGKPLLRLDSVTSVPLGPGNDAFVVRLKGEGFDADNKSYNKIQMNESLLELCWSESECALRNLRIRGNVLAGGRIIELTGLDPTEERSASFRVWINGSPTGERTDSEATWGPLLVSGSAAAVTLLMIGLVLGLVAKYLHPIIIEGTSYVMRALFLDKETNTYSLSKLQFYLWTIAAVFAYMYLAISRNWFQHFPGLPAVPPGLPGIVAIAGGTAVGAQVVTNINGPKGAGQLKPSLADFVTSGDVVAAERVQFFVWTIIGALGFMAVVFRLDPRVLKELPNIPSSVLVISGLSSFGYLGGKLARDPGPVITEIMTSVGPDPEVTPANQVAAAAQTTPSADSRSNASVTTAKSSLLTAQQRLQAIAASAAIQVVMAAANKACDAASAAIKAAEGGADPAASATIAQKFAADADAASREAATAVSSLPPNSAKSDSDNTSTAASVAQQASAVAQTLFAALKSVASSAPGAPPTTGTNGNFGRIELRGRMLSRDANFRVSKREENDADDLDISFDKLQPSPSDEKHLKKPRLVERDSDSTDENMAKRLLLVINLTGSLPQIFVAGTKHTITVINPDSQKVQFKFQVPESQKAG